MKKAKEFPPEEANFICEYGCYPLEAQLNYSIYELKDGSFEFGEYTGD